MIALLKTVIVRIFPKAKPLYREFKKRFSQFKKLSYGFNDIQSIWAHMRWSERDNGYARLSAELIFQYHKLEKGLCMAKPWRFFGAEPANATLRLLDRWDAAGYSRELPVYLAAVETLRSYRDRLAITPPPAEAKQDLIPELDAFLARHTMFCPEFATPIPHRESEKTALEVFADLMVARRSVRNFSNKPVDLEQLKKCIQIAQFSPSACNRQPWRVHIYTDKPTIKKMLSVQNGNAGFGHQLSTLLVICSDSAQFFDASERHEPYIDGGLFAMSLILALQGSGIASCCLNWCVTPESDQLAHRYGDIPDSEKIIMYLAVGYANEEAFVPRSARRHTNEIAEVH